MNVPRIGFKTTLHSLAEAGMKDVLFPHVRRVHNFSAELKSGEEGPTALFSNLWLTNDVDCPAPAGGDVI